MVIISKTAHQNPLINDRLYPVLGLTETEQLLALKGHTVVFESMRMANGKRGTKWRTVYLRKRKWYCRLPDEKTQLAIFAGKAVYSDSAILRKVS